VHKTPLNLQYKTKFRAIFPRYDESRIILLWLKSFQIRRLFVLVVLRIATWLLCLSAPYQLLCNYVERLFWHLWSYRFHIVSAPSVIFELKKAVLENWLQETCSDFDTTFPSQRKTVIYHITKQTVFSDLNCGIGWVKYSHIYVCSLQQMQKLTACCVVFSVCPFTFLTSKLCIYFFG